MSMEVEVSPHICGCVDATNVGLTSSHMTHCDKEVGNPIIRYKSDPPTSMSERKTIYWTICRWTCI